MKYKGINKKACLAHIDPHWDMDLNHGLLCAEQIKYIVRTSIKIIGHRRLLILYVYPRAAAAQGDFIPRLTVFQASDTFITYERKEDGTGRWRTAQFDNLGDTYDFSSECAFYSHEDEITVLRFCKPSDFTVTGLTALRHKQIALRGAEAFERQKAREQKIITRMKPIRPISSAVKNWMQKDILPQYIFYSYKRTKKPVLGYCTHCGQAVEIAGPKHNLKGQCPLCHADITFKCRGRQSRIWDRASGQIIQKVSDHELVIRIIKAHRTYLYGEAHFHIHESARALIRWDTVDAIHCDWYYCKKSNMVLTPWKKGLRPRFSYWQDNFEADLCAHLYTANMPKVFADTPWQYCQIWTFYRSTPEELEVQPYLSRYLNWPAVEYLVKLKLFRLASYVIYHYDPHRYFTRKCYIDPKGKNFQAVLGVNTEHLSLLQELDASYDQLGLLQGMLRSGIRPNVSILTWSDTYGVNKLQDILVPLTHTTAHKLIRYVTEQHQLRKQLELQKSVYRRGSVSMSSVLSDYRDYLCMCEGLDYDMKNTFVLFPKNLKEAHDNVTSISDAEKAAIYERQIQQAHPLLEERYHFEKDGWLITAPHSAKEITDEGQALHHCVGTYVKRMAMKECLILFLRNAQKPDKPFATIEVVDNDVAQARGFSNGALTPSAEKFLNKWKRQVLNNPARAAVTAIPFALEKEEAAA